MRLEFGIAVLILGCADVIDSMFYLVFWHSFVKLKCYSVMNDKRYKEDIRLHGTHCFT